jgi:hypothetical protein
MPEPLRVEVFPVEPDRWVAVVDNPDGVFSTEVTSAQAVESDVRESIAAVLERTDLVFVLIDDQGAPWSPAAAPGQLARLGVRWGSARASWWRRILADRQPAAGACPACSHEWREHLPAEGQCSECTYEIEHGEQGAPTAACRLMSPV